MPKKTKYMQIELPELPNFTVDWIDVVSITGRYWPEDRTLDIRVEDCDGSTVGEMSVTLPEPIIECPWCGEQLDEATHNRGDYCDDCNERLGDEE
jgi:hypothetical protein